jgi:solute carrier family 50 protein (sugar transporter)
MLSLLCQPFQDEVLLRCGILLVFVLVILGYFFYIETDNLRGINALGIFCNVVAVAFFASPLATMREVVQTKSTETMSLPLSVMAAITTFLWTSYGFLKKDVYIVMPNLLGFLLTCTQLALFAIYWSSPKKRVVSIERLV